MNEVNGTVAVVDSDPDTGVFPVGVSQSGSFAYDYQVTGDHADTVQVLSADQNQVFAQSSATVKVNVRNLDIAKAVTGPSFTRTYNWSLGKPDPASLEVHVGEQASYSVPVTVTATDSGWKVEGTFPAQNVRIIVGESASLASWDAKTPSEIAGFQLRSGKLSQHEPRADGATRAIHADRLRAGREDQVRRAKAW